MTPADALPGSPPFAEECHQPDPGGTGPSGDEHGRPSDSDTAGQPLVSVVVASKRGGPWLDEAVTSVLTQTMSDLEVVVVDDGVPGGITPARDWDRRVRLIASGGRGIAMARNLGNAHARGRYIAVIDEDDIWLPEKLAVQLRCLEAHPDAAMCHTQFERIDAAGNVLGQGWSSPCTVPDLLAGSATALHSSTVWRRDALVALGGYDPDADPVADADLLLRTARHYQTLFVPDVLVRYRMHEGQASGRTRYRIIHQAMQRVFARQIPALASIATDVRRPQAAWVSRRVFTLLACDEGLVALRHGQFSEALSHLGWALRTAPGVSSRYLTRRLGSFTWRRVVEQTTDDHCGHVADRRQMAVRAEL